MNVLTKSLLACGVLGAMAAQADIFWEDDFEAYPVSNPADFSATGNWTWNGVGTTGNDNRIFQTGNFAGTQLWIAHPDALGSGITSSGIDLDPNTDYSFVGNIVAETSNGLRDNEFAIDLLVGADIGSAVSVVGGPITVIGRGDGAGGVPAGAIDDSYEDQITQIDFNTGAMSPTDLLFIDIVYVGPGPSADPGFAGVDNIQIIPEPSSLALVGLFGLALAARRRSR